MTDFLDPNIYCLDASKKTSHRDILLGKRCQHCSLKRLDITSSLLYRQRSSLDLDLNDEIIKISSVEASPTKPPYRVVITSHLPKPSSIADIAQCSAFTRKLEASYLATIYFKVTLIRPSLDRSSDL